jgi:branched-chain amino acid transport system substrate-binding protein
VVAPGQPILIGVATDSALPSAANPSGVAADHQSLATEAGSIHGHPIRLQPFEVHCDASSPAGIVPAPEILTQFAGVIGPACSRACVYSEGLLYASRITMVAPACTAGAVVRQGFSTVFRLAWDDDDQGAAAARYLAADLGLHRAVIVRDTSIFSRALTAAFARSFKARGGSTTEMELPPTGPADTSSLALRVSPIGPDGIFVATDRNDAAQIYAALVQSFPRIPVVGTDVILAAVQCGPNGEAAAGARVQGSVDRPPASPCALFPDSANGFVTAGLGRSKNTWRSDAPNPSDPELFRDQEADAVQIYVAALTTVASPQRDGSLLLPRQALRDAISDSRLAGRSGQIAFDSSGERRHDVGAAVFRIGSVELGPVSSLHR